MPSGDFIRCAEHQLLRIRTVYMRWGMTPNQAVNRTRRFMAFAW
jgi:hypothetical protein